MSPSWRQYMPQSCSHRLWMRPSLTILWISLWQKESGLWLLAITQRTCFLESSSCSGMQYLTWLFCSFLLALPTHMEDLVPMLLVFNTQIYPLMWIHRLGVSWYELQSKESLLWKMKFKMYFLVVQKYCWVDLVSVSPYFCNICD